ncbi:hypothetical protein ATANTOWER_000598 [Ataeniobius toweri]|uniref:PX domain-containing protein n=1 Tax=Ataeniobius toweri TaxID=208326 RepID=A0ABU7BG39_9TELE|nr:hypothetical protein [Ataeniobius toweri]
MEAFWMEAGPFPVEVPARKVCVVGSELVENYTVYIIDVTDGLHKWTVKHRYSDFYDLHEKLTAEKKVDRHLLPPKKILGKNSKSLVERRQKELALYLQTLLQQFPEATPTPLAYFLHFHLYVKMSFHRHFESESLHRQEYCSQLQSHEESPASGETSPEHNSVGLRLPPLESLH